MNIQTEQLDGNKAKLQIELPAEEFRKALNRVYNRQKGRLLIPGFRKGKAPRNVIEKMYGKGVFYEDAANDLINENYPKAYQETDLDIVSQPDIDVVQIEEGQPFIFTAVVALRPDVKLAEYKGVKITKLDSEVKDEDIDARISEELETNSRSVLVEDGEAQEGDTVVIDYEGFCNGEAFEGGKGENHPLELGSHSFIEGFEDQLIGVEAGDEVQVEVTFPEAYHAPSLAGKDATFIVKVHEVRRREVPVLDDEYVQDIGFDSIDEYRADIRSKLEEEKKKELRRKREDEAMRFLAEQSEIDVPEEMIETQINSKLNDYAMNLQRSGISFSDYLRMTGMTVEKLRDSLRDETVEKVRGSLVLEEIVKVENIETSEDDLNKKLQEAADRYHMTLEEIKKDIPEDEIESIKGKIAMEKAIDLILDNAVEVEKEEGQENSED